MTQFFKAAFLAAALTVSASAPAAQADACDNATGGQAGLDQCYDQLFKKSDAELNKLYKQIEVRLKGDAATTKLLVTAQRAWVAFRDAECNFQSAGAQGGSVGPMIYSICLDGLTQSRIKDFQGYLKCEEGDTSCPVPAGN
ncbi:MAG: lysozyme inhibitor LprI family protein [Pseudomonadota bacterium]